MNKRKNCERNCEMWGESAGMAASDKIIYTTAQLDLSPSCWLLSFTLCSHRYFDNDKSAAQTFDLAAFKRFGPSASTNFPLSAYPGKVQSKCLSDLHS